MVNDEWWYMGEPCQAHLKGLTYDGRLCDGIESHGAMCGPCVILMTHWLEQNLGLYDQMSQIVKENHAMWVERRFKP